jgi:prepilin-type N-terminal cleavage/methylation domain-containing protein
MTDFQFPIKSQVRNKGFTLLEMIIYVVIFAIILFVMVQLFWQVQLSDIKGRVSRETKENASQVMEIFKHYVRQADDMNTGDSVFDSNPGVLSLEDDGTVIIDTYTKDVMVGEGTQTIRKLRLTEGGNPALDLTSDHVNVDNFVLTDLTQGANPDAVLMDLTISSVNPGNDPLYEHSLSIQTGATIRNESL